MRLDCKGLMYVYTAIIAIILQVALWHMESALALKYYGDGLESWLAGHLEKGTVLWRGGPVCEYTR